MEHLQEILAKAVVYQIYVIFGWLAFLTLLALWTVFRQRKVKKLTKLASMNFDLLRAKIDEIGSQQRHLITKQSGAIIKALKESLAKQKSNLAETASVSSRIDQMAGMLREQIIELQQYVASAAGKSSGLDPAHLAELSGRLEELADEMAWSHHYYDDLKTLEVAVEKLVGAEKMQQLVAKEKTGNGRGAAGEEFVRKSRA
ncbi:MAG: hypothetical protein P9L99_21215 [Candidatus Lernaella stagnicola]|nr:hypothetical protein [Candidatus Lernaella stagnicola]